MYLFFQLPKGAVSSHLIYTQGKKERPCFQAHSWDEGREKRRGCGSGVGTSAEGGEARLCALSRSHSPGAAGLMRSLGALQTAGVGGGCSEAAGRRAGNDGPSSMLAGGMLSQDPRLGRRPRGFFL